MPRIVSGVAGSLALEVPKQGTRPTSDRVREAVFSALDARNLIEEARVLDLYAGSGALGLEAASRGAERVTLVEKDPSAAAVLRRNVRAVAKAVGPGCRFEVRQQSVERFLAEALDTYTLVFLDPPYVLADDALARDLDDLTGWLSERTTVVVERAARSAEPAWPGGWELDRHRPYGDTAIWIATTP